MSAVRGLAAGFASWMTKPRSPTYTKVYADNNDAESLPPSPGFRTGSRSRSTSSPRWLQRLTPKAILALVVSVLLFSCLLFTVSHTGGNPTPDPSPKKDDSTSLPLVVEKGGPRRFRVIVPADGPSPDLCKMLMSALVAGYPSPVIVNWGRDFGKSPGWFGGSHLGKIDGALEFLDAITSDQAPENERLGEDDLVIVVDAYDLWFQLPPSVLIQRYLRQNHVANERIREKWGGGGDDTGSWFSGSSGSGSSGSDKPPPPPPGFIPTQSIIISTQKKCWPDPSLGSDPHCEDLPESPLRKDLYGPHTDENPDEFHDVRPRFVNSGSFMGPVGDMRRMLRRAQAKVDEKRAAGLDIFSDQGIFAELFGEQEIWRTAKEKILASASGGGAQPDHDVAELALEAEHFDYGIGLDYIQDLFTPTVFEEDDGEYIVLNNVTALEAAAEERVIVPPRVRGVPEDMVGLRTPIAEVEADINADLGWGDVPLYTDFWTTSVPVMVHHNAHRNGLKGLRLKEWWPKTWFFPHLRQLLEIQSRERDLEPLFKVPGRNGTKDLVYWAPAADAKRRRTRIFDRERLKDDGLPESDWDGMCKVADHEEWWTEILQDGKGSI